MVITSVILSLKYVKMKNMDTDVAAKMVTSNLPASAFPSAASPAIMEPVLHQIPAPAHLVGQVHSVIKSVCAMATVNVLGLGLLTHV